MRACVERERQCAPGALLPRASDVAARSSRGVCGRRAARVGRKMNGAPARRLLPRRNPTAVRSVSSAGAARWRSRRPRSTSVRPRARLPNPRADPRSRSTERPDAGIRPVDPFSPHPARRRHPPPDERPTPPSPPSPLAPGGLDEQVTEAVLHAAFVPFGDLKDVNIPLDHQTQKNRGFGFVTFVEKCAPNDLVSRSSPPERSSFGSLARPSSDRARVRRTSRSIDTPLVRNETPATAPSLI